MENRRQDPTLLWQVFGSATGVTRYYPGGRQPISPVHSAPHAPPPPWPLILGAWEGMVTLSIAGWPGPLLQGLLPGPGTSLPAPPQSSPCLPQLRHGEPPRKSTCMMSEGDPGERAGRGWAGTPPSARLPAPLPPSIQTSEQGAASSIQFSFHTSLPLENGSHHPGRPPSCLCPHPLPCSPPSRD